MTSGGTYLVVGLGVGIGIGIGIAYLVQQMRATQPPSLTYGMMTDFTRDESGRVISIIEKPIRSLG